MTNCNVCGRDKVADYPECHIVQADYPEIIEMENIGVKKSITAAFQTVQQIRCQFMHWLIKTGIAVKDGELYKLPDNLSLRPHEMLELEEEIIGRGSNIPETTDYAPVKELTAALAAYVKRGTTYFENCFQQYGFVPKSQ